MGKTIILGDSITRGIIIDENLKYKPSKKLDLTKLENELNTEIVNNSIMGATITKGKEKLIKILNQDNNIKNIVIEYGGNDSDYDWTKVSEIRSKDHLPKTILEDYKLTLIEMIKLIKDKNIKPILMTLPPIDARRYFKWISEKLSRDNILYFLGDVDIIYRRQELYSDAIINIAYEYDVDIIDIRSEFLKSNDFPSLLCIDGIHPNEEGQELIVKTILSKYKS